MAGLGTVLAAEALDKSIHSFHELAGVVDSRLIVTIPYIATTAESRRGKNKIVWLLAFAAALGLGAIALAVYVGLSIDLSSWMSRSWLDQLSHLSK